MMAISNITMYSLSLLTQLGTALSNERNQQSKSIKIK
jgi:hypothetical protein